VLAGRLRLERRHRRMVFAQVFALLTVVLAVVPAMAHALELPGKMRLTRNAYFETQRIYYPGFTFAGIAEPAGIVSTVALLFLLPSRSADFRLTVVALLGLLGMQAVYWGVTHPVNKYWVEGQRLGAAGRGFFAFGLGRTAMADDQPPEWTELRDRWEYSHVARAALAGTSLIALLVTIARHSVGP